MEVSIHSLRETTKNLKDLEFYPKEQPIGFEDKDHRFMVAVLVDGKVMKKHISRKNVKLDVSNVPDFKIRA